MRRHYHEKYGLAYEIKRDHKSKLMKIFYEQCREHGIVSDMEQVFTYLGRFPEDKGYEQLTLF